MRQLVYNRVNCHMVKIISRNIKQMRTAQDGYQKISVWHPNSLRSSLIESQSATIR